MSKVTTRIEEIVLEITTKLDVIQKESICVGSLLIEAKEELQEKGGKYADFIDWCGVNFNIGKAQASKLMRVANFFKEDKRFVGVAMRVLYALACNATPDQLDRAAVFADSGTLSSAVVEQLLNPKAPEQEKPEEPKEEEVKESNKAIEDALNNVPIKDNSYDVPFSTEDLPSTDKEGNLLLEVQELRGALAEANKLITELSNAKVKHNQSAKAPFLPQFKSACPYAVLGLGQLESKKITKVRSAFREIIKCGYGEGHEAFDLLVKAKDQLIADIDAGE